MSAENLEPEILISSEPSPPPEERLPILPISGFVLFPGMIVPVVIQTARSLQMIETVLAGKKTLAVCLQKNQAQPDDQVGAEDLYGMGNRARVIKMLKFPDETVRILVQGLHRASVDRIHERDGFLTGRVRPIEDRIEAGIQIEALTRSVTQIFQEIVTLSPSLPEELRVALFNVDDPGRLADLIAANLNMSVEERQELLEEVRPDRRLKSLTRLLNREREVLRVGSEIQNKVSERFSKSQREVYLREQLKAIQKELGEQDQQSADIEEIEKKLEEAGLPDPVRTVAEKEKGRLRAIQPASPEYGVIRTYLDWLSDMPWSRTTEDHLDIRAAETILHEDHYDLEKVKERILEYLSVLKLKADMKGPILCFAGPPGVGKTSLGQSIARAIGREFIRMSLGGVHDEAEIRGHRRTYIGAMPGRIIQGIRRAGTSNPVFMLDEIDKVNADFRGDPSSALLEVLDPAQNHSFTDHYLDVPFDLSRVLFICTANVLDTIPPPLRDRMEILYLSGYTMSEKVHIARRFLVPRQIREHGLKRSQITIRKDCLETVVADYTREAGVRNLDRQIAHICRKAARSVAEGRKTRIAIGRTNLKQYLGPRKFEHEAAERRAEPGVVTGLAWTPTGGDILFIEATRMKGKGQLVLTGSLGDVMKESARAALSYVRANAASLGIDPKFNERTDLHIHVPAGAIPKDGPSAGLAITLALVSLLTGRAVPPYVAMTGEITLRGRVMPVGGIKEKVLAASRAGATRILLPARNKSDLEEIPAEIRKKLTFRFVNTLKPAIRFAMEETDHPPSKRSRRGSS
jgi:ATP-dependent Lon protease